MYQLIAYKGAANGWAPIGRPRPFADACRLMRAANAVNGDIWSYRLKIIAPELARLYLIPPMIRQTDLTPGQWARFYQAEQATGRPVSELLADFASQSSNGPGARLGHPPPTTTASWAIRPVPHLTPYAMTPKISDLLAYASQQARIEARDYFHPRYARPDEIRAWRNDRGHRDRDRRRVFRTFPGRIRSDAPLIPGSYGGARRLDITADAMTTPPANTPPGRSGLRCFDYFNQTNAL
jgi:hypothetical protein